MNKTYDPKLFEQKIYKNWLEKKYFHADNKSEKPPFTILMPPPNITGQLHIGHALDMSLQDIIIRYKRMSGYNALWLPGTDHASIATEVKIVEKMREEGISKEDIGREKFLERAFEWKEQFGGKICEQVKFLGCSCDWDRIAFTMDENLSRAVKETFVRYYEKGYMYRGARIVNMCPSCKTAISDAEVEYETEDGSLWHIKYPQADGGEGIIVATTRPETLLGDMAVAVNPDDERYTALIGKQLILPLTNRTIPVIADEYVEKEFGSGAVKITPAHDPNDFEVGLRHKLDTMRVMSDDGKMNENAGAYEGMDRYEARAKMVSDLEALGLLVKIEKHVHNVGHCHRCHSAIEPIVSKQWFLKMTELAKMGIDVVKNGEVSFLPKRFEKQYLHWMENLKDWCVSRQLWWGHRLPVYYCEDCGEEICSREEVSICPKCGGKTHQDEDVLDTWFSSALWPFSTLGWPNNTDDLKAFYPTNVLVTAYDIISFWVARMIFSGLEYMDERPFEHILIHGLVRDEQGRKLSKSLGNGIDPLVIIDEVGADVLRMALVSGVSTGGDIKYSTKKQDSYRNFMNKIWNASRFVLMNAEGEEILPINEVKFTLADKWLITRLDDVIGQVNGFMNAYDIGIASSVLYDFIWSEFCDWYIELAKIEIYSGDKKRKQHAISVLIFALSEILKLLHPIVPFITAEIYSNLPNVTEDIMISTYPTKYDNDRAENQTGKKVLKKYTSSKDMLEIISVIRALRNVRNEFDVKPSKRTTIFVKPANEAGAKIIKQSGDYIVKLASGTEIVIVDSQPDKCTAIMSNIGEFYLQLGDLVDYDKEKERTRTELNTAKAELARAKGKLSNQGFVAKAPESVIKCEEEKVEHYIERIKVLEEKLLELEN